MDESFKIQMDIKNNAEDLQRYLMDLRSWEEEMKEKNDKLKQSEKPVEKVDLPPPRNKIKQVESESTKEPEKKSKKISAYDYSSWDKYDADKACEEVDPELENNEEQTEANTAAVEETKAEELPKQKNLKLIDEAFYEKELGNQFVRKEKWNEAIPCYTKAIELDPENAIYYANRALCFIKLKNFKSAEVDSTVAIQLDKNYVKAYQRRAFARTALGQLNEAKSDYQEVLRLEPKNSLAQLEISKIDKHLSKQEDELKRVMKQQTPTFNPKSIFESKKPKKIIESNSKVSKPETSNKKQVQISETKTVKDTTENVRTEKLEKVQLIEKGDGDKIIVKDSSSSVFKELPEGCSLVFPISKPPHKRSKKPLRRIPIQDVGEKEVQKTSISPASDDVIVQKTVLERSDEVEESTAKLTFEIPKTCVQFQKCWNIVKKDPEQCFAYLQKLNGQNLSRIFGSSLESDLFSEIISHLANEVASKDVDLLYRYLLNLTTVQRFGSLVMFMSSVDRKAIEKCITALQNSRNEAEIAELKKLYELK